MSREFYTPGVGDNDSINTTIDGILTGEIVRPVFLLEANFFCMPLRANQIF